MDRRTFIGRVTGGFLAVPFAARADVGDAGDGVPPTVGGWATVAPLTLNAGASVSLAQHYTGPAGAFSASGLPAGVSINAAGLLTATANARSATATVTFTVTEGTPPVVVDPPVVVIPPATVPTGALKLLGQYTMKAATNEPGTVKGGVPAAPGFGKHFCAAYRPGEKAMYLFGGDGTTWSTEGNNSGYFHFGKIEMATGKPVFQHFYPYWGISGKIVPAGYDFAPFVYDRKRDCFWQIGGFFWGSIDPTSKPQQKGWVGDPRSGGVWKFTPGLPFGEWSRVSMSGPPIVDGHETMTAVYVKSLDKVLGIRGDTCWTYDCATGATDQSVMMTWSGHDNRNNESYNPIAYDESKGEILYLDPVPGNVIALDVKRYPPAIGRRIGNVGLVPNPGTFYGQFPMVFVPPRRELVFFYGSAVGIRSVNIDTGAVTSNPYPAEMPGAYVTQAVFATDIGQIIGVLGANSKVAIFGWAS
jgi:hypothetical protein